MAITKILPVRGQLKGCLDYAANPQKTEYFSTADMQRLIGYTQNKDKTEHQLYVSGFNCMPQNAYCIMQATKQRWGKPLNGGNVGYHIIQSFKPGEATPDQVHEIGCEFARRFLADRFECTVSTHLDKGHLHNHIVVNSVSFMDGRMFRNDFTTYYKGIRAISDELCRENRLSVVETDGHGKLYTVHQGIKPQCLGVVLLGGNQRRQFLPHQQGVLVGQRRIIVCVCVQLYIFKMLAHSKVVLIQLLHFAHHIVHKSLAERN